MGPVNNQGKLNESVELPKFPDTCTVRKESRQALYVKYPKKDNLGRSAQIPGARSPWRLNLARWRLISDPSKKPVSYHPSQARNFVVVLKL
jgi:hypothetical protein